MYVGNAMSNFSDNFRVLQLHRVPFLTMDLLRLLIPKMRNLGVLGVYKCQLIHVGDTLKMLDIVQMDRPKGKEHQISLDFFPNLHIGPILIPGANNYSGNYGVTWDSWLGDTCLAIWSLMTRILPIAKRRGVDLISPGTMFRKWLDMTPCLEIDATIEAIFDTNMGPVKFISMVDYLHYQGRPSKVTQAIPNRSEGSLW